MYIKTSKLGQEISEKDLIQECKAIYGGVSWPGKRAGFVVVIGMDKKQHFDNHDIYLLDEYESFDMQELVSKCGMFNYKYRPKLWVGDRLNDAADRFIKEINSNMMKSQEPNQRRGLSIYQTPLLEMNHPYQYLLSLVKGLLDVERRQLFLKDSKILNYLNGIRPDEVADLELGEYPAIEALSFAVIEMRRFGQVREPVSDESDRSVADSYAVISVI